jgi:hypothetical protein
MNGGLLGGDNGDRRYRPRKPSPKSAVPSRARDIGSGTGVPNFSPLDIGALAEGVVVAN